MSQYFRLDASRLAALPPGVRLPGYDRKGCGIGIAHLGVGAFHKAHQAVYTDDAMAKSGGDWAIAGVSLKSPRARDELEPQNCLYSLGVRDGQAESLRIVGALKKMHVAPENPARVVELLARPSVHVIMLTITEKGYCLDGAGRLDLDNADIRRDLTTPQSPVTAIGYLAAALRQRRRANAPVTIVSCDNLSGNGGRLARALDDYLGVIDKETRDWREAHARCPATMVDRIVPATTPDAREATAARLGLLDEACVKTEPFSQWVIESDFAGPRPDWAAAGAEIVADVAPYETMKLRLLNGAHSAIAYLGSLAGLEFVHDVMANDALAAYVRLLMDEEIAPEVARPPGVDLANYASALRARFSNAALRHRTAQIAQDGSMKLPQRLIPILRAGLREGRAKPRATLAVAAWMRHVSGRGLDGGKIEVIDPLAARFAAMKLGAMSDDDLVRALLSVREVFDADLAGALMLARDLSAALGALRRDGVHGAVGAIR